MLGVLVINSTYKDKRNSGNHDIIIHLFSDIDECKIKKPCAIHAKCKNTPGSYKCECKKGFQSDGVICTGKEMKSLIT